MLNNHKGVTIRIGVSLTLLAVVVVTATFYYRAAEGWSLIDSLYFSVATAATVGYGDMVPDNTHSKVFTIFYMITSVSLALYNLALISQKRILYHMNKSREIIGKQ